jgi:hypothetical protein
VDYLPLILIIVALDIFVILIIVFRAGKRSGTNGYIHRKSLSDIRINVPITVVQLEEFMGKLDEALVRQQDFIFILEDSPYEFPYAALSDAHWRYQFEKNDKTGEYRFDLVLKSGIGSVSPSANLTFEEFKTLVHRWAYALKKQDDFHGRLRSQEIHIPREVVQQGKLRFEYEYEVKPTGKKQYELEFHLRGIT